MKNHVLLLLGSSLFLFSTTVNALKCYVCNSLKEQECGDKFDSAKIKLEECDKRLGDEKEVMCVKGAYKDENGTHVVRRCEKKGACEEQRKQIDPSHNIVIEYCEECAKDGCNGDSAGLLIIVLIVVVVIVVLIIVALAVCYLIKKRRSRAPPANPAMNSSETEG